MMITAVVLGAAQGARHSFEPDHLAAVSVMIGDRRGVARSAWLGAMWGVGHTASLVVMCLAVLGFGAALPASADQAFTVIVALVLIGLGIRSLHGSHRAETSRPVRSAAQGLAVGAIHGLAGSSALTAMVFAALPTTGSRIVYITLFGLGSTVGMAAVSGAAGLWLHHVQRPWMVTSLRIVIGLGSIAIGLYTGLDALVTP